MATDADLDVQQRTGPRDRLAPYAIVLGIGLAAATGIVLADDRDPFAWAMPVLVLTALLLVLITLVDGRPEARSLDRAAGELGFRRERARTLPPVTPLLAAMKEPRTVQTLEGDLDPGQPRARLARARIRGVDLALCLADLPGSPHALEDPHGVLEATGIAAPPGTPDHGTATWLAEHPLHPGYATGDDALVVFAPVRGREDVPWRVLLDAARELHARLGDPR